MGSAQHDAAIVNQVQRQYNGLGQMTAEFQEHSGAVNLSTSLKVQYTYSEMSGGANHSRLVSMTYPNGRVLSYTYATGLDDTIGRLSSISDTSATLESYTYIGLGTLVKRAHPQTGVDLTYIGSAAGEAGDIYVGLDRFGRVADQRWATSAGVDRDRFKYGYDRDSNRLYELNTVYTGQSELYGYDGLNRLASFKRGTLLDVNGDGTYDTISGQSKSQSWGLDALGNWSTVTTDGTTVTRVHDRQNRLKDYDTAATGNEPNYDANGNMIVDQLDNPLVYDAWNRLVKYDGTAATFAYDALGRRVRDTRNATTTDLYHSAAWQVVEERVGTSVKSQFVWSPAFVDAMICRDRDADANAGNGLEERLYPTHDANFNITSLLDASGNTVERYTYLPYGERAVFDASMNVRSVSAYNFAHGHQGGSHDLITGLIHFRHREFSCAQGRWVSADPLGYPDGMSRYEFVRSGPVGAVDPWGQVSQRSNQFDSYADAPVSEFTKDRACERYPDLVLDDITLINLEDGPGTADNLDYVADRLVTLGPRFLTWYLRRLIDLQPASRAEVQEWLSNESWRTRYPLIPPPDRQTAQSAPPPAAATGMSLSQVARNILKALGEVGAGVEVDLATPLGFEAGAGVVQNFADPLKSGVYGSVGPAAGYNTGVGAGVIWVPGGSLEGPSATFDFNVGPLSFVVGSTLESNPHFVLGASYGRGAGASAATTVTKKAEVPTIMLWAHDLANTAARFLGPIIP